MVLFAGGALVLHLGQFHNFFFQLLAANFDNALPALDQAVI